MNFPTAWRADQGVGPVSVATLVGLVIGYVAVSLLASQLFLLTGAVPFDPAVGLVVPFSLVFGWLGIGAAALGLVTRDLVHAAIGTSTVVVALSHLLGGYLAYRIGPRLGLLVTPRDARGWAHWFVSVCFLALVVAAVIAGTIGWGNELLGIAPFYLSTFTVFQYFSATVVLAVPALALVTTTVPGMIVPSSTADEPGVAYFIPLVAVISFGWFVLGVVGSIGFRVLSTFPTASLRGAGLGVVVTLRDSGVAGPGAIRPLTLLTTISIALLVLLVVTDRRKREVTR